MSCNQLQSAATRDTTEPTHAFSPASAPAPKRPPPPPPPPSQRIAYGGRGLPCWWWWWQRRRRAARVSSMHGVDCRAACARAAPSHGSVAATVLKGPFPCQALVLKSLQSLLSRQSLQSRWSQKSRQVAACQPQGKGGHCKAAAALSLPLPGPAGARSSHPRTALARTHTSERTRAVKVTDTLTDPCAPQHRPTPPCGGSCSFLQLLAASCSFLHLIQRRGTAATDPPPASAPAPVGPDASQCSAPSRI